MVFSGETYNYQGQGRNRFFATYYISNWDSEENQLAVSIAYNGKSSSAISAGYSLLFGFIALMLYSFV